MVCLLTFSGFMHAGWWDAVQTWIRPVTEWYSKLDSRSQAGVVIGGAVLGVGAVGGLYWYLSSSSPRPVEDFYEKLTHEILELKGAEQCFPLQTVEYDGVIIIPVVDQRKRADLWPVAEVVEITTNRGEVQHVSLAQIKQISEGTNCLYQAMKNAIFGMNAFAQPESGIIWFANMQDVKMYQSFLIKALELVIPRRGAAFGREFVLGRNAEESEGFAILSPGAGLVPFVPADFNKIGDLKSHVVFIDRFAYYSSPELINPETIDEVKREIIRHTTDALQALQRDTMATYAFIINTSAHKELFEAGDAHWIAFLVHQNNRKRYIYYMDSLCPEDEATHTLDLDIWAAARHEVVQGFIRLLGPIPAPMPQLIKNV